MRRWGNPEHSRSALGTSRPTPLPLPGLSTTEETGLLTRELKCPPRSRGVHWGRSEGGKRDEGVLDLRYRREDFILDPVYLLKMKLQG